MNSRNFCLEIESYLATYKWLVIRSLKYIIIIHYKPKGDAHSPDDYVSSGKKKTGIMPGAGDFT